MKMFGVVGWKDTGKTTLVAALVRTFTNRGFRVSTIKHAHSGYEIDRDGSDSAAHRQAGAAQTALVSGTRWALLTEKADTAASPLDAMLARLDPCDLVLIEGFKRSHHAKIECVGAKHPLYSDNDSIVALASQDKLNARLPVFDRDDAGAIADFIGRHTGLV